MVMMFSVVLEGVEYPVEVSDGLRVTIGERTYTARVEVAGPIYKVALGRRRFEFSVRGRTLSLKGEPLEVRFERNDYDSSWKQGRPQAETTQPLSIVRAPMPGRVVAVTVEEGDQVVLGTPLLILEAMKMQNEIPSTAKGVVKQVKVKTDAVVGKEEILMVIQRVAS